MRFWTTRSSTSYFSCFQPSKKTRWTQTNKRKMNFRNSLYGRVFKMPHSVGENVQGNALFSPQIFRKRRLRLHHSCKHIQTYPPPPPPQTKKFVKSISNSHISLSFLLTINTFIHSSRCRSSLKKTTPDSRPK